MKRRKINNIVKRCAVIGLSLFVLSGQAIPAYALTRTYDVEQVNVSQKRSVMYYADWSVWGGQSNFYPSDIPADQLTHLNFCFLDFDSEGNLKFTDEDAAVKNPVGEEGVTWGDINAGILPALQQLRAENPNLKIGVSVGGWSKSNNFSLVANDPVKMKNFVEQIKKFITYTNMDFVDIDWEYPGSYRLPDKVDNANDEGTIYASEEDKVLYVNFLKSLRDGLDELGVQVGKDYELSIAMHAAEEKISLGVDVAKVFDIVDFANIMTYDLRGAWDETSGHQTGLYTNPLDPEYSRGLSINDSVNYLLSQGADAEKIVIGAAYYTRGWENVETGIDNNNPGLFGQANIVAQDADLTSSRGAKNELPLKNGDGGRRGGIWSYRNLDKLRVEYPGLKEYWDDTAKAPYLYDSATGAFFTYDNVKSIKEKTNYVNNNNLGGMIAWMASNDKPTTSTKRDELTKATKKGLFGNGQLPQYEIVYEDVDVTLTITPYSESWGNSGGFEITLKNNEKLEESNSVLSSVEKTAETIKLAKFYIKHDLGILTSGDYKAGTVTNENGCTIVDLSSVYDAKNLAPGSTYSFRLKANSAPENTDGIKSIELTQRMSKNGAELNKQVVYGGDTDEVVNTAPAIIGISDKTILLGEEIDLKAGVKAIDKEDGEITSKLIIQGEVDIYKEGNYVISYSVEDSLGLRTIVNRTITVIAEDIKPEDPDKEYDFGVGEGIQWPVQVNAPFADMTRWISKDEYSSNGALKLKKVYEDTGVKFFNLGFIQAIGGIKDSKINWGWGGYSVLNESNSDNSQYQGIKNSIKELRAVGGDVTISFGGLNGIPFWEVTNDVEILYNTYLEIVEGYGLTRMDLDIEGLAQNKDNNIKNAEAIKKLQDKTGVDVVLTLPVIPSGLTSVQLDVLEAYLSQGVDIEVINVMTMCYGQDTLLPGENYGTASLRAVDNLKEQLKEYYKKYANIQLSDKEAYSKIGTTPSVGFEGGAHPIFNEEWTQLVVNHAKEKGLAMTSMWSINRDAMVEENIGINSQYGFTNIFKKFAADDNGGGEEVNSKPILLGINNIEIFVGEKFNILDGVTAYDKEDGDLTCKIVVTGNVDINKAGIYSIIYSVIDSKGEEITATRIITVKNSIDPNPGDGDDFDINKIYYGGETVVYKGEKYTCKWWSQGIYPDQSSAWEKEVVPNDDGSIDYFEGLVCVGGEIVNYNGEKYKAKWWTNSKPGSDSSWEFVNGGNSSSGEYIPGDAVTGGTIVIYNGKQYKAKWWTNTMPGSDSSWELVG